MFPRRAHKFNAKATVCAHGHRHPSKAEAKRCDELHLLERAGAISALAVQVAYPLTGQDGTPILVRSKGFPSGRKAKLTFDFAYTEKGRRVVEDTKGVQTPDFKLRLAMFQASHPKIITRLNGVDTPGQGS